ERLAHLAEPYTDGFEFLEGGGAQVLELLAAHAARRAVFVFVIVDGNAGTGVLFAFLVDKTVHDLIDLGGAFAHTLHVLKDFIDGNRTRRDGHDHMLEAVFDALGDLDFAFARKEFDRTHFAHIHAHRIG